jgi:hypothetical protein
MNIIHAILVVIVAMTLTAIVALNANDMSYTHVVCVDAHSHMLYTNANVCNDKDPE